MSIDLLPIEVDESEALHWMEKSLRQGFDVSSAVLAGQLFDKGRFVVLAPDDFKREPLEFATGGVTRLKPAEEALGSLLDEISSGDPFSVVVEDDLMQAADPVVAGKDEPLAFVGRRILRWCSLQNGGRTCARTISRGASGYPLNAFVTTCAPSELGLADRQQTVTNLPKLIVENPVAVVVAAFDAESFLIWIR